MFRPSRFSSCVAIFCLFAGIAAPALAVKPSEQLLPQTTKGFVSVLDINVLREAWDRTQLGHLMKDPVMKPFADDLQEQIRAKLSKTDVRLGLSLDDLKDVSGGEISLALLQPWDAAASEKVVVAAIEKSVAAAKRARKSDKQIKELRKVAEKSARADQRRMRLASNSIIMIVDITGHRAQADELLAKVDRELKERDAKRKEVTIAGIESVSYTFPPGEGERTGHTVYYCVHEDQLIATDNQQVAEQALARMKSDDLESLATLPAFQQSMSRCEAAFEEVNEHLRWFVEPFGFVEAVRAYNPSKKRGTDYLRVLSNQGFDAVRGMGGLVALSTGRHEILHETFIFAPPVKRAPGQEGMGRFDKSANMLDFPNQPFAAPPAWIPSKSAMVLNFNWMMQKAFNNAGGLVDEIAGDEVFEDVIKSIETDPNGPRINVRKEFVKFLSDRAAFFTDYRLPITPQSERIMFAIKVTDPVAVMNTVNKAMRSDPAAKKRVHNGHVVWEIFKEDPVEIEAVQIDSPFGFDFEEEPEEEEEGFEIPNSAVTVAHGHLLIGSHFDYIVEILDQPKDGVSIAQSADYQKVDAALTQLGAGNESFRFFTRTSETYRPTYELMRQGRMPESETIFGKMLNKIMAPEEEGELRVQEFDGTQMPPFAQIQRYLGPAGFYVTSQEDGWSIAGCLLDAE